MIRIAELDKIKKAPTAKDVRAEVDRLGMPQAQLAEALNIDPRTFRRYLQPRNTDGFTPIPFPTFALLRLLRND